MSLHRSAVPRSVPQWLRILATTRAPWAKAAVSSFARTMAVELASRGIRVNTVSPGYIDTPIIEMSESEKRKRAKEVPLGRWGRAEEIAPLVAFLLSREASYITGQDIVVDVGLVTAQLTRE